jgi:hypothetical protein
MRLRTPPLGTLVLVTSLAPDPPTGLPNSSSAMDNCPDRPYLVSTKHGDRWESLDHWVRRWRKFSCADQASERPSP